MNVHSLEMPNPTNQREKLVRTALELFALHGYHGTSVNMIATEAKVAQGLLYNYFSGKEELLVELMNQAFDDIIRSLEPYKTITDPIQALKAHVYSTCAIVKENAHFWRLIHAVRLQEGVAGIMMSTYRDIVRVVTSVLEEIFQKLGYAEPKLEALLFLTQIDGLVILYLQDQTVPIDKLAKHLIKKYTE